ncbi:hypothetical protein KPY62_12970 [Psychrobacter sp. TAE2020]|uniref:hypothetical protein n=1 Tax=Psychrobacter sp. TAE2020 TaxID=2846762 RepID=UPI001C10A2C5|nr:hypothetical protein [Psychrobacter sp. TAE2020]MBU5617984.1 hypothetical protein [Psychrobacter sp. TAE2020]
MNEKIYTLFNKTAVAISLLSLLAMSGCQSLLSSQSGYKKIENAEQAQVWAGEIIPMLNEVNIACAGTYHCEITRIDNTAIISTDTHKPVNSALLVSMAGTNGKPYAKLSKAEQAQLQAKASQLTNDKSVKIIPLTASAMPNLTNYYASVKPIKREVHVNFYPENNVDYIERFALIDEFKEQGTYVVQAYRQKLAENNDSLLDSASPTPLCIDLLKDKVLKRRFCKQPDAESQGEFVELVLANKANKNNKRD